MKDNLLVALEETLKVFSLKKEDLINKIIDEIYCNKKDILSILSYKREKIEQEFNISNKKTSKPFREPSYKTQLRAILNDPSNNTDKLSALYVLDKLAKKEDKEKFLNKVIYPNETLFKLFLMYFLNKNKNVASEIEFEDFKVRYFNKKNSSNNSICYVLDNIDWKNTFEAEYSQGIHIDLGIINDNEEIDALVELKYIYPKGNPAHHCRFIYGIEQEIKNFKKEKFPKTKIKEKFYDATQPIFKVNGTEFLTFFHEGQIWDDIVRLLNVKEFQYKGCNKYDNSIKYYLNNNIKLYLMGVIKKQDLQLCEKVCKPYLTGKLKKIIDVLKDNKNKKDNEYQEVIHCRYEDDINNTKKLEKIWLDYTTLDFCEKIYVTDSDKWIGYLITIEPI